MLAYIRAVYIPIAYQASEENQDMCIFLQVNLAQKGKADIYHYDAYPHWKSVTFHKTLGTPIDHVNAMGIDIYMVSRFSWRSFDSFEGAIPIPPNSSLFPEATPSLPTS